MNTFWYGFAVGVSSGFTGTAFAAGKPVLATIGFVVAVSAVILRAFALAKYKAYNA